MFYKAHSFEPEIRHEMRGGEGDVLIEPLVEKKNLPSNCRLLSKITIQPGCSIGFHEHQGETEIFTVLSGKALFKDDQKESCATVGDTLTTGSGHGHSAACVGNEPLVLYAVIILD